MPEGGRTRGMAGGGRTGRGEVKGDQVPGTGGAQKRQVTARGAQQSSSRCPLGGCPPPGCTPAPLPSPAPLSLGFGAVVQGWGCSRPLGAGGLARGVGASSPPPPCATGAPRRSHGPVPCPQPGAVIPGALVGRGRPRASLLGAPCAENQSARGWNELAGLGHGCRLPPQPCTCCIWKKNNKNKIK